MGCHSARSGREDSTDDEVASMTSAARSGIFLNYADTLLSLEIQDAGTV